MAWLAWMLAWLACGGWVLGLSLSEARRAGLRLSLAWWLVLLAMGPLTPLLALFAWALRSRIDVGFDS